MVLPSKHRFTQIVVKYFHLKNLHIGPQSLLYHVCQKFWIPNGRDVCRKTVHNCITCFKNKPRETNQIMGDLPEECVVPNFPFNVTGIDFCGPFFVKFKNQRKGVLNKIYVSIFVCMYTRAIHLDFVSDLTTKAFIASLKRFFSRRGRCSKIFSHNLKNFVGSNAEIKKTTQNGKPPR